MEKGFFKKKEKEFLDEVRKEYAKKGGLSLAPTSDPRVRKAKKIIFDAFHCPSP